MMMASGQSLGSVTRHANVAALPLYQVIADDFLRRIRDGEYLAGDRLMSVGDICMHYDVSLATAHRSIGELASMGVVKTIPRKGVYVAGIPTPPPVAESSAVQRVILVESVSQRNRSRGASIGARAFSTGTIEEVVRVCRELHLPLEFQFIPVDTTAASRLVFTPRSGDAIIAIGAQVSIALMSHLATPNVPSVLVDAAAPNAHCVLTDNDAGMGHVVRHLHELGHRRIALAVCFATKVANVTNGQDSGVSRTQGSTLDI